MRIKAIFAALVVPLALMVSACAPVGCVDDDGEQVSCNYSDDDDYEDDDDDEDEGWFEEDEDDDDDDSRKRKRRR